LPGETLQRGDKLGTDFETDLRIKTEGDLAKGDLVKVKDTRGLAWGKRP